MQTYDILALNTTKPAGIREVMGSIPVTDSDLSHACVMLINSIFPI